MRQDLTISKKTKERALVFHQTKSALAGMGKNQIYFLLLLFGLPQWLRNKESARNAEATKDVGSIPGSGRSPWQPTPWTEEPDRLQSLGSQRGTRLKRLSKHACMLLFWLHCPPSEPPWPPLILQEI